MATEKTPPHKRIIRAEEGREGWKTKALERREEVQRLTLELARKEERIATLCTELKEQKKQFTSLENKFTKILVEVDLLKKRI